MSPGTAAWTPILAGEERERALDSVFAVARELESRFESQGFETASLSSGWAGVALLFGYLEAHIDAGGLVPASASGYSAEDAARSAVRCLDCAIELLAEQPMHSALYGGFTGVSWVVQHFESMAAALGGAPQEDAAAGAEDDLDGVNGDPNEEIDQALVGRLAQTPWRADYDLISGLVGFGIYALERVQHASARLCLEHIVARLGELAEEREGGITWHTPPELLPDYQRESHPEGHYNLGLAHGVPGVIALLGRVCAAGVAPTEARRLLDGGVAWLLGRRQSPEIGSAFPYSWVAGEAPSSTRSAWCYGDPGAAVALLVAARATGEESWRQVAHELIAASASRPADKAGVVDVGLCHGSGGLALIFARMFQDSGDPNVAEAARYWFLKTLDMRTSGAGIAGYRSYYPDPDQKDAWADEPGLLTGAAGVALALLAASSPVEPAWDRCLAISG